MKTESESQENLIATLYNLVDENHESGVETHELSNYFNTFTHIEVTDQNLNKILEQVDLSEATNLSKQQFDILMTAEIHMPCDIEAYLEFFRFFDSERTGKLYWPTLERNQKKFGDFFGDGEQFQDYFGQEYLIGGYIHYASYWKNNFGIDIGGKDEYIEHVESPTIKRETKIEDENIQKKEKEERERLKLEREEKRRRRLDAQDAERRHREQEDAYWKKRKQEEAKRKYMEEEENRKRREKEVERMQEEEEADRQRKKEEADRKKLENEEADRKIKKNDTQKNTMSAKIKEELESLELASLAHEISWSGHCHDSGKKIVLIFDNLQIKFDGTIVGSGEDLTGAFTLSGQIDLSTNTPKPECYFTKNYLSQETMITFNGNLHEGRIFGNCIYGNNQDPTIFEIHANSQEWTGWYMENSKKFDTKINLIIEEDFVFGIGADKDFGNYMIRGNYNQDTDDIKMAKVYFPNNAVIYKGKSNRINPNKKKSIVTVTGNWFLKNDEVQTGEFEIKGRYGQLNNGPGGISVKPSQKPSQRQSEVHSPAMNSPDRAKRVTIAESQKDPKMDNSPLLATKIENFDSINAEPDSLIKSDGYQQSKAVAYSKGCCWNGWWIYGQIGSQDSNKNWMILDEWNVDQITGAITGKAREIDDSSNIKGIMQRGSIHVAVDMNVTSSQGLVRKFRGYYYYDKALISGTWSCSNNKNGSFEWKWSLPQEIPVVTNNYAFSDTKVSVAEKDEDYIEGNKHIHETVTFPEKKAGQIEKFESSKSTQNTQEKTEIERNFFKKKYEGENPDGMVILVGPMRCWMEENCRLANGENLRPYLTLYMGPNKFKTKGYVIERFDAEWLERFEFLYNNEKNVLVELYHSPYGEADILMAQSEIPCSELLVDGVQGKGKMDMCDPAGELKAKIEVIFECIDLKKA